MHIGIADYGWRQWYGGGEDYDLEQTLLDLRDIGYHGLERCRAIDSSDFVRNAGVFKRLGMDFATVSGPGAPESIEWTAVAGKTYVWTMGKPKDFDQCVRMANRQAEITSRWGIKTALHNHLGTPVESQDELEGFLELCPEVGLVFDTAHLAAAEGNSVEIVEKYHDRIVAMHVKDWYVTNPEISIKESWPKRGRFCALGEGNVDLDNAAVAAALLRVGYDRWVFVEQDTHLQDPRVDLAENLKYLRKAGL